MNPPPPFVFQQPSSTLNSTTTLGSGLSLKLPSLSLSLSLPLWVYAMVLGLGHALGSKLWSLSPLIVNKTSLSLLSSSFLSGSR